MMEKEQLTCKETYKVPSHSVGSNGKMKFYQLCNCFFDIASTHAIQLKWGFEDLKSRKQYWVLSRLHVQMDQYPGFGDILHIETWPKGISRLFALRDYLITTGEGRRMAAATSAWLIIDANTGRPVRLEEQFREYIPAHPRHGIKAVPGKLPPLRNPTGSLEHRVKFSDLDINQHVNAGKYIEWMQDSFTAEHYLKKDIIDFQVNYQTEIRFDEQVKLLMATQEDREDIRLFEGIRMTDGALAFRARMIWK